MTTTMNTLCGIDVLEQQGFAALKGQRVGLVTNHTGRTRDGRSSIDVLRGAPGVELVRLFSPEHGLRGALDERVSDGIDERTGLPVTSLYGSGYRPPTESLAGLDALVYDIQDIGCRFYTYISTLGICMEEAAHRHIRMVVLDRPNPITGRSVEGPVSDSDRQSFTAWHPMPVRHGMTVGELARFYNAERGMAAALIVVPCSGWRRSDWWDATGLEWVNPSPNMRSLVQATLYPAIGLLETTNLSVGRGTDTPFEWFGAPWLRHHVLATRLNSLGLPGIRFVPVRFTPASSVYAHQECLGVNLVLTDRRAFGCLRTGLEIAVAIHHLQPTEWHSDAYLRLLANETVHAALVGGATARELLSMQPERSSLFARLRARHLIYA